MAELTPDAAETRAGTRGAGAAGCEGVEAASVEYQYDAY